VCISYKSKQITFRRSYTSAADLKLSLVVSWYGLLFPLSVAPPYEADHNENVERKTDEYCVIDEAMHFNRPDKQ